jgi:hypothetical protein
VALGEAADFEPFQPSKHSQRIDLCITLGGAPPPPPPRRSDRACPGCPLPRPRAAQRFAAWPAPIGASPELHASPFLRVLNPMSGAL